MSRWFDRTHHRLLVHWGIPYANSLSKASDPYINLSVLRRHLIDPRFKVAAAENLAAKHYNFFFPSVYNPYQEAFDCLKLVLKGEFSEQGKEKLINVLIVHLHSLGAEKHLREYSELVFSSGAGHETVRKFVKQVAAMTRPGAAGGDLGFKFDGFFEVLAGRPTEEIRRFLGYWLENKPLAHKERKMHQNAVSVLGDEAEWLSEELARSGDVSIMGNGVREVYLKHYIIKKADGAGQEKMFIFAL